MTKIPLHEIEDLFRNLIFPFYEIERDMDVTLKKKRQENDAEHSWTLGLVACAIAERIDPRLDIGKIAQLAYVHDLVEIFAGDTSIWDQKLVATKEEREKKALKELKKVAAKFPWITKIAIEYETKSSDEAKFIWAVDKYVATIIRSFDLSTGGRYFKDIYPKNIDEFMKGIQPTRKKAHAHPGVGDHYDEILSKFALHPEWFNDTA